jgi:hypothetical protein
MKGAQIKNKRCVDVAAAVPVVDGGLQVGPQPESDSTRGDGSLAGAQVLNGTVCWPERRDSFFCFERVASSLVTDTQIRACGQSTRAWFRGGG